MRGFRLSGLVWLPRVCNALSLLYAQQEVRGKGSFKKKEEETEDLDDKLLHRKMIHVCIYLTIEGVGTPRQLWLRRSTMEISPTNN